MPSREDLIRAVDLALVRKALGQDLNPQGPALVRAGEDRARRRQAVVGFELQRGGLGAFRGRRGCRGPGRAGTQVGVAGQLLGPAEGTLG